MSYSISMVKHVEIGECAAIGSYRPCSHQCKITKSDGESLKLTLSTDIICALLDNMDRADITMNVSEKHLVESRRNNLSIDKALLFLFGDRIVERGGVLIEQ